MHGTQDVTHRAPAKPPFHQLPPHFETKDYSFEISQDKSSGLSQDGLACMALIAWVLCKLLLLGSLQQGYFCTKCHSLINCFSSVPTECIKQTIKKNISSCSGVAQMQDSNCSCLQFKPYWSHASLEEQMVPHAISALYLIVAPPIGLADKKFRSCSKI